MFCSSTYAYSDLYAVAVVMIIPLFLIFGGLVDL